MSPPGTSGRSSSGSTGTSNSGRRGIGQEAVTIKIPLRPTNGGIAPMRRNPQFRNRLRRSPGTSGRRSRRSSARALKARSGLRAESGSRMPNHPPHLRLGPRRRYPPPYKGRRLICWNCRRGRLGKNPPKSRRNIQSHPLLQRLLLKASLDLLARPC